MFVNSFYEPNEKKASFRFLKLHEKSLRKIKTSEISKKPKTILKFFSSFQHASQGHLHPHSVQFDSGSGSVEVPHYGSQR